MGADVDRPSPLDGFPRGGVVAEDWSGVGAPLVEWHGGQRWVQAGVTSAEEVIRVTRD